MGMNIRVNPFVGALEALPEEELLERSRKTGELLKGLGLKAAIFDLAIEGNERWFRNVPVIGKPFSGYLVVTDSGEQYVSAGYCFGILEKKKANMLNPLGKRPKTEDTKTVKELIGDSGKIGCEYPEKMKYGAKKKLLEEVPGVALVDITREFVRLKAVKSETDLAMMRYAVNQHDKVMGAVCSMLRPDRTERSVVNEVRYKAYQNGGSGFSIGKQVQVRMISAQQGAMVEKAEPVWPGRRLQDGDVVSLSVQSVGLGGFFGSIGRSFVIGTATTESRKMWEKAVELQQIAAQELRVGTSLSQAEEKIRGIARGKGCRLAEGPFLYGVGYAAEEAPCISSGTWDIELQDNMVISVGSTVLDDNDFPFICQDQYLIGAEKALRMNKLAQELVEV